LVAGIVIFSFGGARSGRDLNCQSALTLLIELKPKRARYINRVRRGMLFRLVSLLPLF
jgi:hypothetical protein